MRDKTRKNIKKILAICISLIIIYYMVKYQEFFKQINVINLKRYIVSFGALSYIALLFIYTFKPLLIVSPTILLAALAGNIYGPVKGTILTMVGLFFSSSLAFYIAKKLGKPFVSKMTRGKFLKLDGNMEVHGFKIMFIMRLSTIFPYDALSYAAGLTKIKYADFILASMLGVFPEMLAYSYVGQSISHPFSLKTIIPLILLVVIVVGGSLFYKFNQKDKIKT